MGASGDANDLFFGPVPSVALGLPQIMVLHVDSNAATIAVSKHLPSDRSRHGLLRR
jgi:hypothetical protein